jgi:hypothetical protein
VPSPRETLIPKVPVAAVPVAPQPIIPRKQVTVPPQAGSAEEPKSSPIQQIIHSIEPLIEDSVPRSREASLFKKPIPEQPPIPGVAEAQAEAIPQVLWPVLPNAESPLAPAEVPAPAEPDVAPPPPPSPAPAGKKPNYLAIGILIIAILPIIAGLVIVANIMGEPSGSPVTTPTMTTVVTTVQTPAPQITRTPSAIPTTSPTPEPLIVPRNGVWVRASYPGTYIGSIGTPGNWVEVTGTGDKFYPISTIDGIVSATLQKKDGSGDKIILEVYRNGVMVHRESTTTPKGIVDVQLDLKTLPVVGNPSS